MAIVVYCWSNVSAYLFTLVHAVKSMLDAVMDNAKSNTSSTVVSGARVVCFLKIPMYLTSFSGCLIILHIRTPVHKIDMNAGFDSVNAKFPQGSTLRELFL